MKLKKWCWKWVCMCLVSLLVLDGMSVSVAAAEEPVWDVILMHPEEFFGEAEEFGYNTKTDTMDYRFTAKTAPLEEMEDFANVLMENGEIALAGIRKTLFGNIRMELEHQEEDCVMLSWSKREKCLTVSYEPNVITLRTIDDWTVCSFAAAEYPEDTVKETLEECKAEYGLECTEETILENGDRTFVIGGENKIRMDWYADKSLLELRWHGDMGMETGSDSAVLPDLAAFLKISDHEDFETDSMAFRIDKYADEDAVAEDFRKLLLEPKYQLKQTGQSEDSDGSHVFFEYSGENQNIDWISQEDGSRYHVKMTVSAIGWRKLLSVHYAPGFSLEDAGVYCERKLDSEVVKVECPGCADGNCRICDGSGYRLRWTAADQKSGKMVREICRYCNYGKCRECDGKGYILE